VGLYSGPAARRGPDNGRIHRDNRRRDVCATREIGLSDHAQDLGVTSATSISAWTELGLDSAKYPNCYGTSQNARSQAYRRRVSGYQHEQGRTVLERRAIGYAA
jgi:hypothetical protein